MTVPEPGFLLAAIVAAFLANDAWRWFGVLLSARLDEDSPIFAWVRMVATALVAGLVAKLILQPSGGLALAPGWLRLGAVACGVAVYALGKRSLTLGVAATEVVLIVGMATVAR